jgi:tetratricopeptide (TPR) repeat protein
MPICQRLLLAFFLLLTLPAFATDCSKDLAPGVQLFKQARYGEAINAFKVATSRSPTCTNAWLYLATTYAQQYVPGADEPENNASAEQAIHAYQKVLSLDPNAVNAVKGIAYLNLQRKHFDEAKAAYDEAFRLDPTDPESPYAAAVIDWTMSYQRRMEARANLGLNPAERLKDISTCEMLRSQNWSIVDEGIQHLRQALTLRPAYDDAMAYMNLLYRERADLQCGSQDLWTKDSAEADHWVDRTMTVKRRKQENQNPCGTAKQDSDPCYYPSETN